MLIITIPKTEFFDPRSGEFIYMDEITLSLEHSLVSIAKWESKWKKPFIGNGRNQERTREETIDYIRCMTINKNVDPKVYSRISNSVIAVVQKYIDDPMTATWFNDKKKTSSREIITAETIYYLMVANGIPFECQKWHLNRLLTLIHVCQLKSEPKRKMSRREEMATRRALNAQRRARHNTRG